MARSRLDEIRQRAAIAKLKGLDAGGPASEPAKPPPAPPRPPPATPSVAPPAPTAAPASPAPPVPRPPPSATAEPPKPAPPVRRPQTAAAASPASRLVKPNRGATSTALAMDPEAKRIRADITKALRDEFPFDEYADKPADQLRHLIKSFLGTLAKRPEFGVGRLNAEERELLFDEITANQVGLGPLEKLLDDRAVTDVMVNGHARIFYERGGKLHLHAGQFDDNNQLLQVIQRIVAKVGRRVDESSAMVDARMEDGSRFNAIIPPLALDGPAVSIRRFGTPIRPERLMAWGAVPEPMMKFLSACVKSKRNIVISGGTGSGKTTLLNCLSSFVPNGERIITIEDSAELQLQQDHVIRLESRPPNTEGTGQISQGDLLTHALRMRPDRIILGEIRGAEAIDMLQAMNTGNDGSMATVHSNSPSDALARFETMVSIGMPNMGERFIRSLIASALDIVVQLSRLSDGSRRCTAITEISGMEDRFILTRDIFRFRMIDTTEVKVVGQYEATGLRPSFLRDLDEMQLEYDPRWFDDFKLHVDGPPKRD